MNLNIRLETPADHHSVEALTREAFWIDADSQPYTNEHLLVHKLRQSPNFIPELDYVAELDGRIVGHIIYTKAEIVPEGGPACETLTFGPLSVLPECQNQGVGRALMTFTIAEARRLGYTSIVFFGHPDYYPRFGFRRAAEFGLTAWDGQTFDAFMAVELTDGGLAGVQGRFREDPAFSAMTAEETAAFDKQFPPKAPREKTPIGALLTRLEPAARAAVESLGLEYVGEIHRLSEREVSRLPGVDGRALDVIRAVLKENGRIWGRAPAHTVKEVRSAGMKSDICNIILRALPDWFGIEESLVSYVREVRDMPFFAAFDGSGDAHGFAALKFHNEYTAEVYVMGVLKPYHRHGLGWRLMDRCVEECRRTGRVFLTVKTLDQSRADEGYDKTRRFYHAMGFRPLEVFPTLWDENNPCLFMVKYLGGENEHANR